jgi:hypothetical protein
LMAEGPEKELTRAILMVSPWGNHGISLDQSRTCRENPQRGNRAAL